MLTKAADKGYNGCVEELIKAGADVNSVDLDGDTALMCAAITGKGHCVSTLIEAGADVNIANNDGYVPIMCFARNGDDKSITELIRAGADVNIVNKFGETALQIAKTKDHLKCIGTLVQAGAVVNDDGRLLGKNKMYTHTAAQGQHDECNSGGACNYNVRATSSIQPTAPAFSNVNDLDIEQPPPYEKLFHFVLK